MNAADEVVISAKYQHNGLLLSTVYAGYFRKKLYILAEDETEADAKKDFLSFVFNQKVEV